MNHNFLLTILAAVPNTAYKERYKTKPILVISTGGDEFFMVDDSKFYYNQLEGPTYFRMVPNAEHSLALHETSVMFAIRAFYLSIVTGTELPKMTWKMEYANVEIFVTGSSGTIKDRSLKLNMQWNGDNLYCTSNGGRITLQTDQAPQTVHVYHATTLDDKRKDFRLLRGTPGDPSKPEVHPVIWLSKPAKSMGNNTFVAECNNPDKGWTAFFIQVTFQGVDDSVLEFTTQTLITPDTYPFPDCHGPGCHGILV